MQIGFFEERKISIDRNTQTSGFLQHGYSFVFLTFSGISGAQNNRNFKCFKLVHWKSCKNTFWNWNDDVEFTTTKLSPPDFFSFFRSFCSNVLSNSITNECYYPKWYFDYNVRYWLENQFKWIDKTDNLFWFLTSVAFTSQQKFVEMFTLFLVLSPHFITFQYTSDSRMSFMFNNNSNDKSKRKVVRLNGWHANVWVRVFMLIEPIFNVHVRMTNNCKRHSFNCDNPNHR